jgi:hypothetical protein
VPEPKWSGRIPGQTGSSGTLSGLTDVTGQPSPGTGPVYDNTGNAPLVPVVTQTDLDAILAQVAEVNWRTLNLADPRFTPFGQGYADPRYRLTLNNVVHCEGLVACSPPLTEDDVGVRLATLDSDSTPGATLLFGCSGNPGNNARFDVTADGQIVFNGLLIGGGQIDWFTLTPITFSVGTA